MAEITSEAVQKLRAQTGAGIMDCKRALASAGGDMEKAVKTLREQGAASAAKKAGRVTGDGLVTSYLDPLGKTAVLLELNCETDFVARTEDFIKLIADLARRAGTASPAWKGVEDGPGDLMQQMIGKLGENLTFRRFVRYDKTNPGVFGVYIHPSGGTGKVGVLLELSVADPKMETNEEVKTLARDLAMQIAAANPRWVKKEDVPAEMLEQEKAIAREQARRENKPEKIWDKIAQGKLQQFYQQFCLLEQPYVKDAGGKTPVGAVVQQLSQKTGVVLSPARFVRYKVGEE
ncbi:MAG TPA: translation elongation factor Ts [Elusimicrobiota bacterium]|nr:translation elongation factor Ts [Elusimicrobiota bacterium]